MAARGIAGRIVLTPDRAEKLRFLVGGGVNTLFGLAFYPALLWTVPALRERYLLALLIAQVVCLAFAFMVHKYFVFRNDAGAVQQFLAFSSFYAVIYVVNWVTLPAIVEGFHIAPVIVQTGFTLITVAGSYFWHRSVTFRQRRSTGSGGKPAASVGNAPPIRNKDSA
jgi:putative flippase GtrA